MLTGAVGVPTGSAIAGNAITHTAPPLTVLTRDTSDGNGDIFIAPAGGGYPAGPEIVTAAGKLLFNVKLPAGVSTYRAYLLPWNPPS